ncbi:MAG: hypothetical protein JO022_15790 [Acidobacteriaceae bacterium]|nr:hypothetical protein [Acidobacteriaceae bacterium]
MTLRNYQRLSYLATLTLLCLARASAQDVPKPQAMSPLPAEHSLKVLPLAGNHEKNDVARRVMSPLVVEILDQNDMPVEGAEVVFRFPISGATAAFDHQEPAHSFKSNGQGEAAATGWIANETPGKFTVHVTASRGNQIGETTIEMENAANLPDPTKLVKAHKSWALPR